MKDFVREYWKTAAAGAAGAFLLSLLVGLVTRNPFGIVFMRALLLGVLFAGLLAVIRYLIRTHLRELAAQSVSAGTSGADTNEDKRGSRVDIVLPEEGPIGAQFNRANNQGSHRVDADEESLTEADTILNAGLGEGGANQAESDGLGELAEELAEELPGDSDHTGDDAVVEEESREKWSARTAGHGSQRKSLDPDGPGTGKTEDREGLPDISNLEIETDSSVDEQVALKGTRPARQRPDDALRGAVSGQDPATIARAIRTVLKRDDKG